MRNRAKSALATAGYSQSETSALALLIDYAAQNSGLNYRNYYEPWGSLPNLSFGDYRKATANGRAAFSTEGRDIGADWRRVKEALQQCAIDGVTDADVIAASPGAFNGRLEWVTPTPTDISEGKAAHWSYCVGQYWPTEYRKAVAAVLESASRERRRSRPAIEQMPQSIAELKALNQKNGGCWFESSTMRFFGTRIESGILAGCYFITSEQPPHGGRTFSVRSFNASGDVDTVGEFSKASSKAEAMAGLREYLTAAKIAA